MRVLPFSNVIGANRHSEFWSYGPNVGEPGWGLFTEEGVRLETLAPEANGFNVQGPFTLDSKGNVFVASGMIEDGGPCAFYGEAFVHEYAAGSSARKLLRTIDVGQPCIIPSLAADDLGNLYVAEQQGQFSGDTDGRIAVYASGVAGPKPTRTLPVPIYANDSLETLRADPRGNVFAGTSLGVIYEFPNAKLPRHRLPFHATRFDVDARDNVYALITTLSASGMTESNSIEIFAPGSKTPLRTIAGPETRMRIKVDGGGEYSAIAITQ
jgi:hypothetical protein